MNLRARYRLLFRPPPPGCVLYAPGVPGGGAMLYDRSPYGNNGTITGAGWVRLPSGLWCLDFDGNDDQVNCGTGSSLDITGNQLTLSWWLNSDWDAPSGFQFLYVMGKTPSSYVVRQGRYPGGGPYTTKTVVFTVNDISVETANLASLANSWIHVAARYSGSQLSIYINGSLESPVSLTGNIVSAATTAFRLATDSAQERYYKGRLALVRVFNRCLTDFEVQRLYHEEKRYF